ncbi:hypothetical protein EIK77_001876 [Talaromyces pinophilus]|nr:hypothetical protein EIK77_001876 [Talaromyces pinophilus]
MSHSIICTADSICRLRLVMAASHPYHRAIAVEDVDTRWPYRAGYPRLLRPRVQSRSIKNKAEIPISEANFEKLKQRISEITEAYGITHLDTPEMVYRAHASPVSDRQQIRIVVHCVYEKDLSHSKTWAKAVTEIYQEANMSCEQGMEIGVELFDFNYMSTSRFVPGPSEKSRELSTNWNKGQNYHQKILQLFENRPHMWQAMMPIGVRAKGKRAEDHRMVIYFDALNAEDDAWDDLEEAMRSILPEDVGIEILQNTGSLFCNDKLASLQNVSKPKFSADNYIRPPRPGCEISIEQDNSSSGTMGGYIITEAKDTGRKTTFGVTNAHIVLGSKFQPKRGLRCSPGEETRRRNENVLCTSVTGLEGQILKQTEIIAAVQGSDPALAQRLDKHVRLIQPTVLELKDSLQLTERDATIGPVQVAKFGYSHYETPSLASSDSKHTKLMMDLALIRMDCLSGEHPRDIFFKVNGEDPQILDDMTYNSWEVDSLGNSMDAEEHIVVVAKVSRRGIYTMGHVTEFKAEIEFPIDLKNGVKVLRKRSAWVVSTPFMDDQDGKDHRTRPGDSGSLIIAANGWEFDGYDTKVTMPNTLNVCAWKPFVVGLLFGSTDNGDVTYFIPFDAVKSEIESLTGEEMVWPPKRSSCIQRWEEGYDDDEL